MEPRKRFILEERDIPRRWYNIVADMPQKPRPALDPVTRQPLTQKDLSRIFSEEASRQELNTVDRWIETAGLRFPKQCGTSTVSTGLRLW